MNAVDNELLSVKVAEFPSIWWIARNTTTPMEYYGESNSSLASGG
jgi:hypothetical protein